MAQMELPLEDRSQRDEPTLTLDDIDNLYGLFVDYSLRPIGLTKLLTSLKKPGALETLQAWLEAKDTLSPNLFA